MRVRNLRFFAGVLAQAAFLTGCPSPDPDPSIVPHAEILVPDDGTTVAVGSSVLLAGRFESTVSTFNGLDSLGRLRDSGFPTVIRGIDAAVWTSSIDGDIGVSSFLRTSELSLGDHMIVMTVTENRVTTASKPILVRVRETSHFGSARITSPLPGSRFEQYEEIELSAMLLDASGNPMEREVECRWYATFDSYFFGACDSGISRIPQVELSEPGDHAISIEFEFLDSASDTHVTVSDMLTITVDPLRLGESIPCRAGQFVEVPPPTAPILPEFGLLNETTWYADYAQGIHGVYVVGDPGPPEGGLVDRLLYVDADGVQRELTHAPESADEYPIVYGPVISVHPDSGPAIMAGIEKVATLDPPNYPLPRLPVFTWDAEAGEFHAPVDLGPIIEGVIPTSAHRWIQGYDLIHDDSGEPLVFADVHWGERGAEMSSVMLISDLAGEVSVSEFLPTLRYSLNTEYVCESGSYYAAVRAASGPDGTVGVVVHTFDCEEDNDVARLYRRPPGETEYVYAGRVPDVLNYNNDREVAYDHNGSGYRLQQSSSTGDDGDATTYARSIALVGPDYEVEIASDTGTINPDAFSIPRWVRRHVSLDGRGAFLISFESSDAGIQQRRFFISDVNCDPE